MKDLEERKKVLQKFTKSNLRLSKLIEGSDLVALVDQFVSATMGLIQIHFKDFAALQKIVRDGM
jgi:hypothetical protein